MSNDLFRDLTFKVYSSTFEKSEKDGRRLIRGYASTSSMDLEREIISRKALEKAKDDLLKNHTVFIEHNHSALMACGKVVDCTLDDKGLLITVELSRAKFVDDIFTLCEEGILNSFSIGGIVVDGHDERGEDGKSYHVIDEILILEVSIVGIPCNQEAKFSVCKSFNSAIAEQIRKKEGSAKMAKQDKQEVTKTEEPQKESENVEEPKNEEATSEKVSEETKEEVKDKENVESDEKKDEENKEEIKEDSSDEKVDDKKGEESVLEADKKEEDKVEDSVESKEEAKEEVQEKVDESEVKEEVAEESEAIAEASSEASDAAEEKVSDEVVEKSQETSLEKESEEVEEKTEDNKEEKLEEADEEKAEWTTEYINTLPNSSFAVIEPAYLEGKTEDKNCRHLPFKDENGEVDLPHYRNALARVNQIKPVTDSISEADLRSQAAAELEKYRDLLGKEKDEKSTDEKILDALALIIEKLSALDKKEVAEKKEEVVEEPKPEVKDEKAQEVVLEKKVEEIMVEKKEEEKVEKTVEKKEETPTRKSLAIVVPSPYDEGNEKNTNPKEDEMKKNLGWSKLIFGK